MTTPFFPAFRPRLAALGRRALGALRQSTLAQLGEHLRPLIPTHLLSPQDEGKHSRERVFTLRLTFECFLWQVLNPATSCREVVRQVQALCRLGGRQVPDEGTSAYVQARQHLPRDRFDQVLAATARAADQRAGAGGQLAGRPVKVVDGSTTQLPDTAENQEAYPQPSRQAPGCGFPVMKFVALFSLASGAVLNLALGNLHGHELRLFRQLWEAFKTGDILLGDRAWGEYGTLAGLPQRGVDVVARLHQGRKADFRKAQRFSRDDGLFTWQRGRNQSGIFSDAQWAQLPEQITVRILRFTAQMRGFRSRRVLLVTTLLDPQLYRAQELIALYARRWGLELWLRDIKTTMGMEQLRCQTPQMAEKELMAYLIAHNLTRCVMAQAAARYQAPLERISFKGTVDALRQYSVALARARNRKVRQQLWEDLLLNLVRDLVPWRPHRQEPRALKRRRKPYPLLNKPRRQFTEVPHRNRYWKNNPRKNRGLN